MSLTEDQRRRIEESREKALALRASRLHEEAKQCKTVISRPTAAPGSVPNPTGAAASFNTFYQSSITSIVRSANRSYDSDITVKRFKPSTSSLEQSAAQHKLLGSKDTLRGEGEGGGGGGGNVVDVNCKKSHTPCSCSVPHMMAKPGCSSATVSASRKETIVPAHCILVSSQRFVVEARYFTPLIDIFKSIASRQYGKLNFLLVILYFGKRENRFL